MTDQSRRAIFTATKTKWATDGALYSELDKEFRFTLDPCPLNPIVDGLVIPWKGERVYCNPPYGRGVSRWLEKAQEAEIAVYLLPSRTDTRWWHDYAMKADEIRFVRGRLRFNDSKNSAPFPSVLLIYRKLAQP